MKFTSILTLFALCMLTTAPQAEGQSSSDEWQFAIAPYLWAAGMDGKMTIGEHEQDIDVPFSTIIDNLDFALMGHFDMRNERWVVASDLVFVDVESTEDLDHGSATAGMDMTLLEVSGGYRVSPVFTLLVGARWVDMGASVRYDVEDFEDGGDASKSWVDPLVGVHMFAPLSERWLLGARADVGGFGVGSELTWQAYADIGFKVSDLVTIFLGYHALDIDYEKDDAVQNVGVDILVSGPQLGVAFTF